MKTLYKFAGVIAILCAMTLSTLAQSSEEPVNFIFSSCVSTCEMKSISFDKKTNEMTITVTDPHAPAGVAGWDSLTLRWFAEIETDSVPNRLYGFKEAHMSWQEGRNGGKHANISVRKVPVKSVMVVGSAYTYTCSLSSEQVTFLKSFAGMPDKCKNFSFGMMTGY